MNGSNFIVLLLAVGLAACGGQTPTTPLTAKEHIQELERRGELPQLDRSPDLRGPDANANGVRDDVEAHIATLPISAEQKRSAYQLARSLQTAILTDASDAATLREASVAMSRAAQCLSLRFPDSVTRAEMALRLESVTANTAERAAQYIFFNDALSGAVFTLPKGDTCED